MHEYGAYCACIRIHYRHVIRVLVYGILSCRTLVHYAEIHERLIYHNSKCIHLYMHVFIYVCMYVFMCIFIFITASSSMCSCKKTQKTPFSLIRKQTTQASHVINPRNSYLHHMLHAHKNRSQIHAHTNTQFEKHLEKLAGDSACACLQSSSSKAYREAKLQIARDLGRGTFAKKLEKERECDCKKAVIKGVMRVLQQKVNVAATKLTQTVSTF
jgi:hypothetical protein